MKVLHQMTMYDPSERSIVFQDTFPVPYLHWHREMQIIWVREGHGTVIVGNYIDSFRPGEIYIVGANQPHLFRAADENQKNVRMLCLYMDHRHVLESVGDQIPELRLVRDFWEMADNGLKIPGEFADRIGSDILRIKACTGLSRFIGFLELTQQLVDIGSWSGWKPLSAVLTKYSNDVSDRLNQIYRYTLDHYMEDILLEDIAALACMTPNAFCTYFKKYTRKTYFAFLNDLRISEACKKLLYTDFGSIGAVAYQCGFANSVTFNRVFKKAMGMTPTEYVDRFQIRNKVVYPFSESTFN